MDSTAQTAIRFLDGLVVDEDTGEILEWPEGFLGGDRVATLIGAYHDAKEQAERWEKTANLAKFALTRIAEETGARKLTDDSGTVTLVAEGKQRRAPVPNLQVARQLDLINDDMAGYIAISATKELDVKAVEEVVASLSHSKFKIEVEEGGADPEQAERDRELWRSRLMAVLVNETPRRGYTLVKPAAKRIAVLERETVEPFEEGE